MKKTFLARRNALLSPASFVAGVASIGIVMFIVGFRLIAPDMFMRLAVPVFVTSEKASAGVGNVLNGFRDAIDLASENETLKRQNATLDAKNRLLEEKYTDINKLNTNGIKAGVVARPPQSGYDTLVVASGTEAGVTLGMEAFAESGVPVGVVSNVSKTFAHITLFSSPGFSTSGWVGADRIAVTLVGKGGGAFEAEVPSSESVLPGAGVFVPGPGALFMGTVINRETTPESPSARLLIAPAINPFSITWVVLANTEVVLLP